VLPSTSSGQASRNEVEGQLDMENKYLEFPPFDFAAQGTSECGSAHIVPTFFREDEYFLLQEIRNLSRGGREEIHSHPA
jgi:hypothetical protein